MTLADLDFDEFAREQRLLQRRPAELLDLLQAGVHERRRLLSDPSFVRHPMFGVTDDSDVETMRSWLADVIDALSIVARAGDLGALKEVRGAALEIFDDYAGDDHVVDLRRTNRSAKQVDRALFDGVIGTLWALAADERTDEVIAVHCAEGIRLYRGLPTDGLSVPELVEIGRVALRQTGATSVDRKVAEVLSALMKRQVSVPSKERVHATRAKEPATRTLEGLELKLEELLGAATTPTRATLAENTAEFVGQQLPNLPSATLSKQERVQLILVRWGDRNLTPREFARSAIRALGYSGGFITRSRRHT